MAELKNRQVAFDALQMARDAGAAQARVTLAEGCSTDITILDSKVDTMQNAISTVLRINLFVDGRYGAFTTNRPESAELKSFIKNAVESVRLLVPDLCRALPERSMCYDGRGEDLKLTDPDFQSVSLNEKMAFLTEVAAAIPSDSRLISSETGYEDVFTSEMVVDTAGLEISESQSSFSIGTECTVQDSGDIRPQNYSSDGAILFSALEGNVGRVAFDRTVAMLGARPVASGRYPVIVENTCSRSLVSTLVEALSGSALQQHNSFLNDSLGKKLFPSSLTLCDRPHIPGMCGSTRYDSEGIATVDTDIIKNGVVNTYYLGTYYARKMGMPVTVNAPFACCFPWNDGCDRDGMVKRIGRGILITGFNGGNCNPLTGDFSYGIEGFFFENGVLAHPVKEMNFSGNMLSLWNTLALTGNDPLRHTRWQIPSLAFEAGDFSGI